MGTSKCAKTRPKQSAILLLAFMVFVSVLEECKDKSIVEKIIDTLHMEMLDEFFDYLGPERTTSAIKQVEKKLSFFDDQESEDVSDLEANVK